MTGARCALVAGCLAVLACAGPREAVDTDAGAVVAPAAPEAPAAVAAPAQAPAALGPAFSSSIETVTAADLWASWRPGCPVGVESLRRVTVSIVGFDGVTRSGVIIVHEYYARNVIHVFSGIFAARFPIARMEPIEAFGGSDSASMDANNTSGFNCRAVTGGSTWSEHSYGWAIDINPVQNPYVNGSTVLPPAGRDHLDRSPAPGRITAGDAVVQAFASIGWGWGGNWTTLKDYQHFSATGR